MAMPQQGQTCKSVCNSAMCHLQECPKAMEASHQALAAHLAVHHRHPIRIQMQQNLRMTMALQQQHMLRMQSDHMQQVRVCHLWLSSPMEHSRACRSQFVAKTFALPARTASCTCLSMLPTQCACSIARQVSSLAEPSALPDGRSKPTAATKPRSSVDVVGAKQRASALGVPATKKPRTDAPSANRAAKQPQAADLKRTQSCASPAGDPAPNAKLVKAKSLPSPSGKTAPAKSTQPNALPQVKTAQAAPVRRAVQPAGERVLGQKHQREGSKDQDARVRVPVECLRCFSKDSKCTIAKLLHYCAPARHVSLSPISLSFIRCGNNDVQPLPKKSNLARKNLKAEDKAGQEMKPPVDTKLPLAERAPVSKKETKACC